MPRFIVTEIRGWPITRGESSGAREPGVTFHVLDTAYNHKLLRSWESEGLRYGRGWLRDTRLASIRQMAEDYAADLEAKYAA